MAPREGNIATLDWVAPGIDKVKSVVTRRQVRVACDFAATCLAAVEMSATMTAKLQDDMNSIPLADDDPQGENL